MCARHGFFVKGVQVYCARRNPGADSALNWLMMAMALARELMSLSISALAVRPIKLNPPLRKLRVSGLY